MKEIVEIHTKNKETISTMESCTGGAIANEITNIPGASEVIMFGAVTYSNDYKIKLGVDSKLIDKYTVYSEEVAKDMSKKISDYTNSDYGIGVTGKLNRADKNNMYGSDNIVYICVYSRKEDKFYNATTECSMKDRKDNKNLVIKTVIYLLKTIIK